MDTIVFVYVYSVAGSKAKNTIKGYEFNSVFRAAEFAHDKSIHSVSEFESDSKGLLCHVADFSKTAFIKRVKDEIACLEFSGM